MRHDYRPFTYRPYTIPYALSAGEDMGISDRQASSGAAAFIMLIVLLLILVAYLLARMINTIARAWVQHPTSRGLWFCLLLILAGVGMALGAGLPTQARMLDQETGQTLAGNGVWIAVVGLPLLSGVAG